MALIASIDGPNRDIYLSADTVNASIHPIDIYKEMRTLRQNNEELRKYKLFMEAKGNDAKGGGKFTERYVVLLEGSRIIPYDITHELTVTGTIITDDGQEGIACFDRTPLTSTTIVDINYVPPQVEVITITTGGGDTNAIADAVEARFLFNQDGHVLSEAVGVSTNASIDETTLNRVVQGAIPPPPSNGAIAAELARLLGKPKLYDREFQILDQKISKLGKPKPKDNDAAEIKQLIRMLLAKENQDYDDTEILSEIRSMRSAVDSLPKEIPEPADYMDQFSKIRDLLSASEKRLQSEAKKTRDAIAAIPKPDLTTLATADELNALMSLAKKIENYDDSDLKSKLASFTDELYSQQLALDRKVDMILDNQMDLDV